MTLKNIFLSHFNGLNSIDRIYYKDQYCFDFDRLFKINRFLNMAAKNFYLKKGYSFRHVNYGTFALLIELLDNLDGLKVLETGSSAYGTNSSILFAKLVAECGGYFDTVDIDKATTSRVTKIFNTSGFPETIKAHNSDSIAFIQGLQRRYNVAYLDSFDPTPNTYLKAQEHGLKEFQSLIPHLEDLSYILIDDTPATLQVLASQNTLSSFKAALRFYDQYGHIPGKGALVMKFIFDNPKFTILKHDYQLLIQYNAAS